MQRYTTLSWLRHALDGNRGWRPVWRSPEPKERYDVVIIGGGGHGLATAYYLARRHNIRRVAVLERGWIGGGNSGRNTQVVRSNYFFPASSAFYDHSLCLYEKLSTELNFNLMLSQRGVIMLAHSEHEMELSHRWMNAIRMNGLEVSEVGRRELRSMVPSLNLDSRLPVIGGFLQQRAGIARHDAVVWAFARAADALGVDIIQECEVRDVQQRGDSVFRLQTARGSIEADRLVIAVAGHSSELAALVGLRLPITTMSLQAMVSEPVKPFLNKVVISSAIHTYVSQSDRGEIVIGGGADAYASYAQRCDHAVFQSTVAATVELFPVFSRLRLMRQWAGSVDISPDSSPIVGHTSVRGLYISCGWGTGGFKAIPAGGETMAFTVANDRPHPLIEPFALKRFVRGAWVNEGAAANVAH